LDVVTSVISVSGPAGKRLLEGLFVPRDVHWQGDHRVETIRLGCLSEEEVVSTCFDAAHLPSGTKEAILNEDVPRGSASAHWRRTLLGAGPKLRPRIPVKFFQCMLPDIVHNELLLAIAWSPNDDIFQSVPCRAILSHAWHETWSRHCLAVCYEALQVFALVCITAATSDIHVKEYFLSNYTRSERRTLGAPFVAIVVCVWFRHAYAEFFQALGHVRRSRFLWAYLRSFSNFLDLMRIWLTGLFVGWLVWNFAFDDDHNVEGFLIGLRNSANISEVESLVRTPGEKYRFRELMGFMSAWHWMSLLHKLRGFKYIGVRILPIIHAISDIAPFCIVLAFVFFAMMHAYYALAISPSFSGSFIVLYQLGLVNELSLGDFEKGGDLHDTDRYQGRITPHVAYLAVTFVLTITLMNLFIGVLSTSYGIASKRAEVIFLREQAELIATIGEPVFCENCCCRRRRRLPKQCSESAPVENATARPTPAIDTLFLNPPPSLTSSGEWLTVNDTLGHRFLWVCARECFVAECSSGLTGLCCCRSCGENCGLCNPCG